MGEIADQLKHDAYWENAVPYPPVTEHEPYSPEAEEAAIDDYHILRAYARGEGQYKIQKVDDNDGFPPLDKSRLLAIVQDSRVIVPEEWADEDLVSTLGAQLFENRAQRIQTEAPNYRGTAARLTLRHERNGSVILGREVFYLRQSPGEDHYVGVDSERLMTGAQGARIILPRLVAGQAYDATVADVERKRKIVGAYVLDTGYRGVMFVEQRGPRD